MDQIINSFGIKPILLLAQIVNFAILFFILKKYLYKPLLKVLDERKAKIAQSMKNAEEIEARLDKIDKERDQMVNKMNADAKKVIDEAKKEAQSIIAEAHEKASSDIEKMVINAKKSMDQERDQLHQEIRDELADIVVAGIQKVVGKVLTEKDKKELVEKSIQEIQ